MAALLVLVLVFLAWKLSKLLADPTILPPDDFVEYWAAGHLNAKGQNPYDGELLLPLERQAGRDTDEAVMMWNPPWTLTLAMPIGVLQARLGQLIWLGVSLLLVVGCSDRLWIEYGGAPERRWISWALSLTFMPTLFVLHAGQIGPFILLGITGFLVAERRGLPWLAGACAVLMAIKPHLVYLFWIALAVWSLRRPFPTRWKVIAGGIIVGVVATAIPMACNPDVLAQYWDAMTNRTPEQWKSPTIGSYLREWYGETRFGLQFVPTLAGLAWLAVWGLGVARDDPSSQPPPRSGRGEEYWHERMPMLLLVSFVTASYGAWPFDLVILLAAVVPVAARLSRTAKPATVALALVVYLVMDGAALAMNLAAMTSDKFIWMAPALLVAYVVFRPRPLTT
jgi:hypothetical protein